MGDYNIMLISNNAQDLNLKLIDIIKISDGLSNHLGFLSYYYFRKILAYVEDTILIPALSIWYEFGTQYKSQPNSNKDHDQAYWCKIKKTEGLTQSSVPKV